MLKGNKLQESFLNVLCQKQVPVSVSLVNQAKIEGLVETFDQFTVLLKTPNLRLVYKHSISTIDPSPTFKLPPKTLSEPDPAPETQPKR